MTAVAIFDRDATIIDVVRDEETGSVSVAFHPKQIRLLTGAVSGMRMLQEAGFVLAMATNQPGPAKGQVSAEAVRRTNAALLDLLAREGVNISAVETCMHHPQGGAGGDPTLVRSCTCRKPKPGMLLTLLDKLHGDASRSWMIGDGRGDIEAGRAAGLRTGLAFATNHCELCPLRGGPQGLAPDVSGANLHELARAILRQGDDSKLQTRGDS